MKNWKLVAGLLGGLAVVFLVSFFGATIGGDGKYDRTVMAAWLQATGAIGAILASGWLVKWQFDKQRAQLDLDRKDAIRQRAMHLSRIVDEALIAGRQIVSNFSSNSAARDFLRVRFDPNQLSVIGLALREIPVLELPNSDWVLPIITVRNACERIQEAALALRDRAPDYVSNTEVHLIDTVEHKVLIQEIAHIEISAKWIVDYIVRFKLI
ncbi:hypothetical protein [Burkholderia ubonensis]|uniref:hypothetical protein n=1 Tax=Burkholderia ubonensis TaxID=101571 RepID=UPI00075DA3AD|nr:hypothetical protein [Burkholderia ubonensis]KVW63477.1 hypothetical protein WK99_13090 [Burkholderia ubonensis]